ncbi:MAG: acetylxylan esterase [Planctomycetaceae bacterium]
MFPNALIARKLPAWLAAALCFSFALTGWAQEPRVLEPGQRPADKRLGPLRFTTDKYHPWAPSATLPAWELERQAIRERMLVSLGLWPMPPLAPLNPIVHGKIDRDEYTIEKIIVASFPGHYVTGNLYRPRNGAGKRPGVLLTHGHAPRGRFDEKSEEAAQKEEIDKGAEKFMPGARYYLQACAVGLARMGCTVFHYDMVGFSDSRQLDHTTPFLDPAATLRLQGSMGLQTINSIRALDFLTSLPDVDASRVGVTGSSGGGTQTFLLCALDPRPKAAFPAVMVSTDMQGGCVCENACYLRIGINNVALTALFAPRPIAMSCADDWTLNFESTGLPELKQVYALYGRPELVQARTWREFGHNYNQPAREMMYAWFNRHLQLGHSEPIVERDFIPVAPAELSVYDDAHPVPADALNAAQLKAQLARISDEQFAALLPKDARGLAEYRRVVGAAAKVMFDGPLPAPDEIRDVTPVSESAGRGYRLRRLSVTRRDAGEQIPMLILLPETPGRIVTLWIDGAGKRHLFDVDGAPTAAVRRLLDAGHAVASADVFQTGEFLPEGDVSFRPPEINPPYSRYVGNIFGYNRPVLSNRVRDILTVLARLKRETGFQEFQLVGTGEAGPWVLLARSRAGESVSRCATDLWRFGFSNVYSNDDPQMLPGGLKYGGIGGLAALAAPAELALFGVKEAPANELTALTRVYDAAGGKLEMIAGPLTDEDAAARMLR